MKISIVTPAYNMERWIAETIESVLSQEGDFELEYVVVDDGSKDKTADIVKSYVNRVESGQYPVRCKKVSMTYHLQQNAGAVVAMNTGFSLITGDICTWVDADNTFEPGAFKLMAKAFQTYPEIDWIKGITSTIDESSKVIRPGTCKLYRQDWLVKGIYGQEAYFVEADSVFFRKSLWDKAGPFPAKYRSAGDYWLWMEMAKHAPLWSLNARISNFRKREGQLSKGIQKYKGEQRDARPRRGLDAWKARLFFSPQSRVTARFPGTERFFTVLYPVFFGAPREEYISVDGGSLSKRKMLSYKML